LLAVLGLSRTGFIAGLIINALSLFVADDAGGAADDAADAAAGAVAVDTISSKIISLN
jgi:hypothetical protein